MPANLLVPDRCSRVGSCVMAVSIGTWSSSASTCSSRRACQPRHEQSRRSCRQGLTPTSLTHSDGCIPGLARGGDPRQGAVWSALWHLKYERDGAGGVHVRVALVAPLCWPVEPCRSGCSSPGGRRGRDPERSAEHLGSVNHRCRPFRRGIRARAAEPVAPVTTVRTPVIVHVVFGPCTGVHSPTQAMGSMVTSPSPCAVHRHPSRVSTAHSARAAMMMTRFTSLIPSARSGPGSPSLRPLLRRPPTTSRRARAQRTTAPSVVRLLPPLRDQRTTCARRSVESGPRSTYPSSDSSLIKRLIACWETPACSAMRAGRTPSMETKRLAPVLQEVGGEAVKGERDKGVQMWFAVPRFTSHMNKLLE